MKRTLQATAFPSFPLPSTPLDHYPKVLVTPLSASERRLSSLEEIIEHGAFWSTIRYMSRDDLLVTVLLAHNRLSLIALVENPSVSLEDLKVYGGLDHMENIVLIDHLRNLASDGILTIAEETQNQPCAWCLSEFGVHEAEALLSQYG